jgi:hypothetical protein
MPNCLFPQEGWWPGPRRRSRTARAGSRWGTELRGPRTGLRHTGASATRTSHGAYFASVVGLSLHGLT